ncbi:cell adhesion molecule 2-like [Panulirus ornatus]|uniref:cell adhesion molecule 2-like n=1 Tax=Panulirus ornatus TaxID=150431 RepID=UPI003A87CF9C
MGTSAAFRYLPLFAFCCFAHEGVAMKWVRFSVPSWASRGEDAVLTCQFDLEGERLYSVKWYKAGREFYRYVPGDWPPQQAFAHHGITVDVSQSNHETVTLREVTLEADGRYKCEVLTEAPLFRTLVKSAAMHVVELPQGSPYVTGGELEYNLGDIVNLTCTAPRSIPPATLTWYINDQEAPQDYLVQYPATVDQSGRYEAQLGLQFRAERWHFVDDRVTLRCTASIHRLYEEEVHHSGVVVHPLVPALFEDQTAGAASILPVRQVLVILWLLLFS